MRKGERVSLFQSLPAWTAARPVCPGEMPGRHPVRNDRRACAIGMEAGLQTPEPPAGLEPAT